MAITHPVVENKDTLPTLASKWNTFYCRNDHGSVVPGSAESSIDLNPAGATHSPTEKERRPLLGPGSSRKCFTSVRLRGMNQTAVDLGFVRPLFPHRTQSCPRVISA